MIELYEMGKAIEKKGVLVAAHRGVAAGNIPCNTLPAFEAALAQGADILETDLVLSGSGELIVFHTGKERHHLGVDVHLEQMPLEEIRKLRFTNVDRDPTDYGILTLDEFLEHFKNRCLFNLDHGWDFIPEVAKAVRRHGMMAQVLFKTPSKLQYVDILEEVAPEMMFMPIYKEKDTLTEVLEKRNVNFVGAEIVFAKDDCELASDAYIRSHHDKGRFLWVNPLIYYYKSQLSGGHSDDAAMLGNPDHGWGWLIDKGFDILQTDWVMPLCSYIQNRK